MYAAIEGVDRRLFIAKSMGAITSPMEICQIISNICINLTLQLQPAICIRNVVFRDIKLTLLSEPGEEQGIKLVFNKFI